MTEAKYFPFILILVVQENFTYSVYDDYRNIFLFIVTRYVVIKVKLKEVHIFVWEYSQLYIVPFYFSYLEYGTENKYI